MTKVDMEKAALCEFLEYQRASVRAILADLDLASLRKPVLPSGWSPLGLVEHLGHAERHWFQEVFRGSVEPLPWPDENTPLRTTRSPSQVFGFYRDQCDVSDAIIAAAPLTAAPAGRHPDETLASQTTDLRRIVLHVIEETARHAGHLDVVRELIDGRTGLGPR
ncbi:MULTISPECIES: DinB family protein [unclassified Micromonospora]|uniref:DinB family protein n=1 Tax=unclassified Micromonospora TaxID=2617518 RepID=UPI0022B672D4|nr:MULTISPECIES: DinB family protein [unclassified Micromonospora]MCZ7475031.1 DinB family protein [Micromonospora sp. WMMC273]WBC05652.1 DinB family protein [Micromonospora sp. WMMA1976]